jgi:hypothetical protein
MLGHRPDGKKVKDMPGFFRIIPNVMKRRSDAQVYFKQDVSVEKVDKYIAAKAKQGIKISYTNILYACLVRLIAERPLLNRFVMNGTTYVRDQILVSLVIKKDLSDKGEETSVKMAFDGTETIFDIKQKMSEVIHANKSDANENETDALVSFLNKTPDFVLNWAVRSFRFLDYYGLLPKAIIDASPFHCTAFFASLASIDMDAIYHHLYDFGTTGMFVCMGQTKFIDVYDEKSKKSRRVKAVPMAYVCDERVCDGFYFAKSLDIFKKYMDQPELLEEPLVLT